MHAMEALTGVGSIGGNNTSVGVDDEWNEGRNRNGVSDYSLTLI